jgi:hypothetical protein
MEMSSAYELFRSELYPDSLDEKFHLFGRSNILNVMYWDSFFRELETIPKGLIIECGVGRGRSLIIILALEEYYARLNHRSMREVFALDSFEGFPQPTAEDVSPRDPKRGEWSHSPSGKYEYSPKFLEELLSFSGVTQDNLKIVKGFFNATLETLPKSPISLLHLDGDLYDSYKAPLSLLSEYIQIGGIIVIDDFLVEADHSHVESFPGARKAVMEFLDSNKNFELLVSIRGTPYLRRIS